MPGGEGATVGASGATGFGVAKDANTGRVLRGDEMAAEASPWQVMGSEEGGGILS